MATVTLTATFPIVGDFQDYHDIQYYADDLNKLFDKTIRNAEVGFSAGGCYWGVFYVGRKPNKAVIAQLLTDAGYESYEEEGNGIACPSCGEPLYDVNADWEKYGYECRACDYKGWGS